MNEKYRELNPEELEQVNGGYTVSDVRMMKVSPKEGDEGFEALKEFTIAEMEQINSTDPFSSQRWVVLKDDPAGGWSTSM